MSRSGYDGITDANQEKGKKPVSSHFREKFAELVKLVRVEFLAEREFSLRSTKATLLTLIISVGKKRNRFSKEKNFMI